MLTAFLLRFGTLTNASAVLGTVVASGVIVILCVFLGMCKPVARVLEAIPLAAIVLAFGTFLTIKALMMS